MLEDPNKARERRARQLLGLREFPQRNSDEVKSILKSSERISAFEAITTTTLPASKKEVKKGIVLEILKNELVADEVLKKYPLVYLGSGSDVEYPLALGGRDIILVDPILGEQAVQEEIREKIQKIISKELKFENEEFDFVFDFGEGEENVRVKMVAKEYPYSEDMRKENDYPLPPQSGAIVLYAGQGPDGSLKADESMRKSLVPDGKIIEEYTLINKEGRVVELGTA